MKSFYILILTLVSSVAYSEVTVDLPDGWKISSSVIYVGAKKIGETTSKESWPYSSGDDFIDEFRMGFVDDPETTKFISSGHANGIYWVCREEEYWDGKGGGGIWYARRFWVNGPILTIYSYVSCSEGFDKALDIASTVREL
ncbi:hypothetical protein [Microbulbifer sp. SAOS-129_SWC]|uniref:hypothetical protein n=1 Tax=Microbulbifer sp. SAOS-129_SWC TaxID=3145235 RepID=UPI00321785BE